MIEPDHHRALVRSLTTAGWLTFVGWAMFLFRQVERTLRVSEQRFAGQWDQRIEVLSFVVLLPNVLAIVPPAICAITVTLLAGDTQEIDQAILLRIVRWATNFMVGVAFVSAISVAINDGGPTKVGDIAIRIGGLLVAVAVSVVCRTTERISPNG